MKKPKKTEAPKRMVRALDLIAAQIHAKLKQTTKDVIEIGDLLIESRYQLEHGKWQQWLADNFDLTYRTALNYCKAAEYVERNGKSETISLLANLSPSVLYALANGRYSEEAEKAILAASRKGRVDQTRADDIEEDLADDDAAQPKGGGDATPPKGGADAEAVAAPAVDPESEAILDGPPPEVPPSAPIQTPPNFTLGKFNLAVNVLKQIYTKPLAEIAGTTHSADDLEKIEAFIRAAKDFLRQARRPS